ncbi:MAG: hypothetical protein ACUVSI_05045, partial [Actinomycetota bacterium]
SPSGGWQKVMDQLAKELDREITGIGENIRDLAEEDADLEDRPRGSWARRDWPRRERGREPPPGGDKEYADHGAREGSRILDPARFVPRRGDLRMRSRRASPVRFSGAGGELLRS